MEANPLKVNPMKALIVLLIVTLIAEAVLVHIIYEQERMIRRLEKEKEDIADACSMYRKDETHIEIR